MAIVMAYLRQRFAFRVFGPAIALLALLAYWATAPASIGATAGLAVVLMAPLIVLFRVWDDIEDSSRDRIAHPERILPRSPAALFNTFRLALLVATLALFLVVGTWRSALGFSVLTLIAHIWYRYARAHLGELAARYALLLKYPAFVALVTYAIAPLHPARVAAAALLAYLIACVYEALHDPGGAASQERAPHPGMFEPVSCYLCGSQSSTPFISSVDDLTGRPGRFTFVQCAQCSTAYQSPRLTIEHIKSYYGEGYIAHRKTSWGALAPFFEYAMGALDRAKLRIVERAGALTASSSVLDVGCGAGGFLSHVHAQRNAAVAGVDFVDLSSHPGLRDVEFHHGLFYERQLGAGRFDVVTMWHFLEHDYDPMRSLAYSREVLKPGGHLIVEVPRLDSLSSRLFKDRWPGLQAPQHTVLYDRASFIRAMEQSGFEVVEYLPYGAFPPYFYLFCGVAFTFLGGRGLNLQKGIWAYLAGQILLLPILPFLKHANFAMQTVICRKASP